MTGIIPRRVQTIPTWHKALFYFLIFLLIVLAIIYFTLNHLQGEAQVYFDGIEKELSEMETPATLALETEVFSYKKRIDDFAPFLEKHVFSSRIFEFLENETHPKVFFLRTSLDLKSSVVSLSGITDNFLSLGQQLSIFKKQEMVESLGLSNISLSKRGGIEFDINISFNKKLFEY